MRVLLWIVAVLLAIVVLLLVLMYTASKVDALAWRPAPNPGLAGDFAPNQALASVITLISGVGNGPEDVTRGPGGYLYTGFADGRIVRFREGGESSEFANTGGRPLGMQFDGHGQLIVADAYKGLLSISPGGKIRVLTNHVDGKKMRFVDDLDIAQDGTIWFSDASQRFDYDNYVYDFLEGSATGRLLSYSPATGETRIQMEGLFFANGVALGPLDAFVLVTETGTGRIHRLWLKGEPAGHHDLFFDALPGGPDNLSFNGVDTFWVAIAAIRDPALESMADKPLLRRMLGALPKSALQPRGQYGFVVGLDLAGRVKHNLQAPTGPFHTVTSVNQFGERLFLGSISMNGVGVLPIP